MRFNEYEVYKTMKLRQEEVERNARNAWKSEQFQKEALLQRLVKKWKSSQKPAVVKTNCNCVCDC